MDTTTIIDKVNKTIGLLQISQRVLLRPPLVTIYKPNARPHLDYVDML